MSAVVERMGPEDIEAVAALEVALFPPAAGRTLAEVRKRVREDLEGSLARAWVARDAHGAAVAYIMTLHAADELHVLNVATLPAHRRRGLARALVEAAVAYAALSGVRLVVLEVRRSNDAAIRLYRAFGFAAMGYRRRYYDDGEDALDMHLELDPLTGAVVAHEDEVTLPS